MFIKKTKSVNDDFFKMWSHPMAYVLGYFVADGSIGVSHGRKNPYTFNITSKDLGHLKKIKTALCSNYKVSRKLNGKGGIAYQIQIRNESLCRDIIKLGIFPKKTYNLEPVKVPKKYFSDFVRGFFDGDGSVYIYRVNGVYQIKTDFVCARKLFLEDFNTQLCAALKIPKKSIHGDASGRKDLIYSISLYIDDSEKFSRFIYHHAGNLYLDRKKKVFEKWNSLSRSRRGYIKKSYPSKVGWYLNQAPINANI